METTQRNVSYGELAALEAEFNKQAENFIFDDDEIIDECFMDFQQQYIDGEDNPVIRPLPSRIHPKEKAEVYNVWYVVETTWQGSRKLVYHSTEHQKAEKFISMKNLEKELYAQYETRYDQWDRPYEVMITKQYDNSYSIGSISLSYGPSEDFETEEEAAAEAADMLVEYAHDLAYSYRYDYDD